jgi:hypothetical protein
VKILHDMIRAWLVLVGWLKRLVAPETAEIHVVKALAPIGNAVITLSATAPTSEHSNVRDRGTEMTMHSLP